MFEEVGRPGRTPSRASEQTKLNEVKSLGVDLHVGDRVTFRDDKREVGNVVEINGDLVSIRFDDEEKIKEYSFSEMGDLLFRVGPTTSTPLKLVKKLSDLHVSDVAVVIDRGGKRKWGIVTGLAEGSVSIWFHGATEVTTSRFDGIRDSLFREEKRTAEFAPSRDPLNRTRYRLEFDASGLPQAATGDERFSIDQMVSRHSGQLLSLSLERGPGRHSGPMSAEEQTMLLAKVRHANRTLANEGKSPTTVVFETDRLNKKRPSSTERSDKLQSSSERTDDLLNWRTTHYAADEKSLEEVPGAGRTAIQIFDELASAGELEVRKGGRRIRFSLYHSDAAGASLDRMVRDAQEKKFTGHEVVGICCMDPERLIQFRDLAIKNGARSVVVPLSGRSTHINIPAFTMAILALNQKPWLAKRGTSLDALRAGYAEARRLLEDCQKIPVTEREEELRKKFGSDKVLEFYRRGGGPTDENLDATIESLKEDPFLFDLFTVLPRELQRRPTFHSLESCPCRLAA
jgi:hypothetical protein